MAPPNGPTEGELRQLRRRGYSNQEIADMFDMTKGAVAARFSRYGIAEPRLKYRITELWSPVRDEHSDKHTITMLRALEKQRKGRGLPAKVRGRLASFMENLESLNAVVAYAPDTPDGFWLLGRDMVPEDWIDDDLPVITERMTLENIAKIVLRDSKDPQVSRDTARGDRLVS